MSTNPHHNPVTEFLELFKRITTITLRSPQVIFSLFGIACFTSVLLVSVFSSIGNQQIDLFKYKEMRITVKNWLGFATYLNQDCFASCFFANIIALPIFLQLYKREQKSGLYSCHMYYFGNWICKILFLTFYPVLLVVIIFPFLKLKDNGSTNYFLFLRHAIL